MHFTCKLTLTMNPLEIFTFKYTSVNPQHFFLNENKSRSIVLVRRLARTTLPHCFSNNISLKDTTEKSKRVSYERVQTHTQPTNHEKKYSTPLTRKDPFYQNPASNFLKVETNHSFFAAMQTNVVMLSKYTGAHTWH